MASAFDKINDALSNKPPSQNSGTLNKVGYDIRAFAPNPNIQKLKELGLQSMPEGGQEQLDSMYAEKNKKRTDKKKSKSIYKDTN